MPFVSRIDMLGYKGFSTKQSLEPAIPKGEFGSGMTYLVGPNNVGKSTITEAFRLVATNNLIAIPEGKRNKTAGERISLEVKFSDETSLVLKTIQVGGSETEFVPPDPNIPRSILVMPSRRFVRNRFGHGMSDRGDYVQGLAHFFRQTRSQPLDSFTSRLFRMLKNQGAFNEVLKKVLPDLPEWTIELADEGQHYLKFKVGENFHDSEGVGEGLLSLFFLIDALYDSKEGDIVIIDEPELSLHPQLQRRLADLLHEYSRTRQIIVSTHSPYFVDLSSLSNGAKLVRITKDIEGIRLNQLSNESAVQFSRLGTDLNNPHVVGLDAKEIFFLDNKVIAVEGQEDVMLLPRALKEMGLDLNGTFFGWGVGGAEKMTVFSKIFSELGYKKVTCILDGDKAGLVADLQAKFPAYLYLTLPANDIRTKVARNIDAKTGLLDAEYHVRDEFRDGFRQMIQAANEYAND